MWAVHAVTRSFGKLYDNTGANILGNALTSPIHPKVTISLPLCINSFQQNYTHTHNYM